MNDFDTSALQTAEIFQGTMVIKHGLYTNYHPISVIR